MEELRICVYVINSASPGSVPTLPPPLTFDGAVASWADCSFLLQFSCEKMMFQFNPIAEV